MSFVLAIDIGTSSIKGLAVDQNGQEIFSLQRACATHYPNPDFAEQNPEEIYLAVKSVIYSCSIEVKEKLAAISFSSAMHSVIAVDEEGNALTELILWSDLRSKSEAAKLRESKQGLDIAMNTGTPIHPMSPLCKILWLKNNQRDVFDKAFKFIGIKEYIWFKFFGCYEIDYGIASATGLFETGKLRWYSPALTNIGITASRLSIPVSVYHKKLITNSKLLSELGLSHPVSCVIGSSDGCLANLGSFAMDYDTLSLTIGTSGAVRKSVKSNIHDPHGKVFRYHLDEETLIEGGATNNGAILIDWFSKNFLRQTIDVATFIHRAAKINPGAEGLIFLPFVFGERAPLYDANASGSFFGIKQHHTADHFMRAILEGIGYSLYSIAELLEEKNGKYKTIVASGGFTKSDEWVQIIANIFGKPVYINQIENASALGAVMLGFKALGLKYSFSEEPMRVFYPEAGTHEDYLMILKKYMQIVQLQGGLT